MEVQVRCRHVDEEAVQPVERNVRDSGMLPLCLTDHTRAFAFDQGVVVAFPEPGFGWFDVQFFEQTGHLALDAFRAGAF